MHREPESLADLARANGDAVELQLRVHPGARRERVEGVHAGALRVAVRAAPERGQANAAVIELLSDLLGVPRKSVTIVSGHTSRNKRARVAGVSLEAATLAIANALERATASSARKR